jgi:hypothetical protein
LIPDPAIYQDWFAQADERRRKLAVGTRRYSVAEGIPGRRPEWSDFLDPKKGTLLTIAALKSETDRTRQVRVNRVKRMLDQRRALVARLAVQGHLPGL